VNGQSCGEILYKWKERLFAVHLSDNDGICDRHWMPGKGHVNWSKITNLLKQTNISTYSMETYPYEEEKNLKPLEFLIRARSNLLSKL
ncbi:MAG: TIM barrel protein, partial [Tissierellia bacterium]|nr:TIM barrel protein [Tissierellia bacterium]